MKKILIVFVVVTSVASANGQEVNKTKIDAKSQMEVLTGLCNRDGLKSNLFKTYYDSEYAAYTPDASTVASIKTAMTTSKVKATIVMGTWCGDSQEQIPRFYKIVDAIGMKDTSITLYCVDRTKKTDKGETDNLNITLVPTFIFYKDRKEIGRITETPKLSLEKDLMEIITE